MSNLYSYMLQSRNKDNKHIPNFKQRIKSILSYEENEDYVRSEFANFVKQGLLGEVCRLYKSVNSRNEEKIREDLIIRLMQDKTSLTRLNATLTSVSRLSKNRDSNMWLFDFDENDENLVLEFISDIYNTDKTINIEHQKTPNGYAIVCSHGFDTRNLMRKWINYDITLKRDDMLFIDICVNE